jgi:hypothetical protein
MAPKPAIVAQTGPPAPLLPEVAQKPSLATREALRKHHGPVTESPGGSALDDAFHAMFELSRAKPAIARLENMLRFMS